MVERGRESESRSKTGKETGNIQFEFQWRHVSQRTITRCGKQTDYGQSTKTWTGLSREVLKSSN